MSKQRIDSLTPDTNVILAVGYTQTLKAATFMRIEGEGDERLASFVWQEDGEFYRWAAYRYGGRWVLGAERTPIKLYSVMDS